MWQVVIQLTKTWRELFGARSPGRRGPSWRDGARPPREGASCLWPSLPGRRGPGFAAVSRASVWSPSGAAGCGVSGAPCRTGPRTRSCGRRTASLRLPSQRAAARRESADGRRRKPALLQVCTSISAPRFSFQQRLLSDSPLCPAGLSCRRSPVCPGATRRLPSGKRAHEGRPPACPSGSQSRAPDPSVSDPLPRRRPLSCLSARF